MAEDILYNGLCRAAGRENVWKNEDMSRHVTFRAGGRAACFVEPPSDRALAEVMKCLTAQSAKYFVMGNGSNLLVRDEGYQGVIVKVGNAFSDIRINQAKGELFFGAGVHLSKAAAMAAEYSFTGMEFAAGIPGMIGGAVAMNAGAYGGEFKDIIDRVWVMDPNGTQIILHNADMEFGYRTSLLQKTPLICTGVSVVLKEGKKEEIDARMRELMTARKEKQPLEYPSAGSTFKRPEGYFAGKLIMDAGLRGFSVGDACVSEKHCGFIVNKGQATASDICSLIDRVKEIVYEKSGVMLESEVKIL